MQADFLEKAKMLLSKTQNTCVLCGNDVILTDNRRGIRPLLELLENGADVSSFCVADKVVGKAAAYLYCLMGIAALYAGIISEPALHVLQDAGISVEYGQLVPSIRNRAGNGPCPMEKAVWNIETPAEALTAIQETLQSLST